MHPRLTKMQLRFGCWEGARCRQSAVEVKHHCANVSDGVSAGRVSFLPPCAVGVRLLAKGLFAFGYVVEVVVIDSAAAGRDSSPRPTLS